MRFGMRPDPPDHRDLLARDVATSLFGGPTPDHASVATGDFVKTRRQRGTNACVGFAWRAALQVAAFWAGAPYPELSPLAIYLGARATHTGDLDGDGELDLRDDGTYLRAAAKAVKANGVPSEETHPFSALRVNKPLHFRAIRDMYHRRGLRGYYRIQRGDEQAIRLALKAKLPVVGGWEMHDNWVRARAGDLIEQHEGAFRGRHAMLIEAAHPGSFTVWNTSWGDGFGDRGRVDVSRAVLLSGYDFWAVDVRRQGK